MLVAEFTWYTDGRNFVKDGERDVGSVVVTEGEDVWVEALPPGTLLSTYTLHCPPLLEGFYRTNKD